MIEVQTQQGVLLAIISLACLGCIYALCLCYRKKSSKYSDITILSQLLIMHYTYICLCHLMLLYFISMQQGDNDLYQDDL